MAIPQICTTDGELPFVDDPNHSPYRASVCPSPIPRVNSQTACGGAIARDSKQRTSRQLSLTLTQASDSPRDGDAQTPQSLDSQQGGGSAGKALADGRTTGGAPTGGLLDAGVCGTAINSLSRSSARPLASKCADSLADHLHVSGEDGDRMRKRSWIHVRLEALGQLLRRDRADSWCANSTSNNPKLGSRLCGYSAVQIGGSHLVANGDLEGNKTNRKNSHNGNVLTGATEAEADFNTHATSNGCVKENGSAFRSNASLAPNGDAAGGNGDCGGGGGGGGEGEPGEQPDLFSGLDRRERFQRKRSNSAAKIVRGTFRALSFRKRQRRLIFKDGVRK